MKVLDPLAGIRAIAGDPIFHMGFFLATLLMPYDQYCDGKHYGNIIPILGSSHLLNSIRYFINLFTPN